MIRKISVLMGAIAVVAFAVPAAANAAALTMPANALVPVGTGVTLFSTNTKVVTSLGAITCEEVIINTEVDENTGAEWGAHGIGKEIAAGCKVAGVPIEITDLTTEQFFSVGAGGSGRLILTFKADLPGGVVCHFQSPALGTPFTYVAGSDKITIPKQKLEAAPAACRPAEMSGDFTVETTVGGEVISTKGA
jgi:hypothetical protein